MCAGAVHSFVYSFSASASVMPGGEQLALPLNLLERLHFRDGLWHCFVMWQWILALLAIVCIELCVKYTFAFPKAAHAFFAFSEDLVELIGLPARKPFKDVCVP